MHFEVIGMARPSGRKNGLETVVEKPWETIHVGRCSE